MRGYGVERNWNAVEIVLKNGQACRPDTHTKLKKIYHRIGRRAFKNMHRNQSGISCAVGIFGDGVKMESKICPCCGTRMSVKATRCLVCGTVDIIEPASKIEAYSLSGGYESSIDRKTAPIVVAVLDWMLEIAVGFFGK